MTDMPQDRHARPPPDFKEGAERGEDVRRTLPEAMDRARQIVREAMAGEADPSRDEDGLALGHNDGAH